MAKRTLTLTRPSPDVVSTQEVAKMLNCSESLVRILVYEKVLNPINEPSLFAVQSRVHWFNLKDIQDYQRMTRAEVLALRKLRAQQAQAS